MLCPVCERDLVGMSDDSDFPQYCLYCGTLVDCNHVTFRPTLMTNDLDDLLTDLLGWEVYMGGFEGSIWARVRKLHALLGKD